LHYNNVHVHDWGCQKTISLIFIFIGNNQGLNNKNMKSANEICH
jgi:hypothetical protein